MRIKTSPIWTVAREKLIEAVKNNISLSGVLRYLGLDPSNSGGRFRELKKRLVQDDIDFSHIPLGSFANVGRKFPTESVPLNEVMVENSTYDRGILKRRLLKDGLLINLCSECGLQPEWNNKELVLIIDHINGIRNDNRLENLRLLCPNCNSQQKTFSGKMNKKPSMKCIGCGKDVSRKSKTKLCKSCYGKLYRPKKIKNRPSKDQLLQDLSENSYCFVGRKYGVTDNTIRKWLR